ncbi:MAG: helix-turn-helix domain-containing protein [Candidatus Dormibacteria bacterium]
MNTRTQPPPDEIVEGRPSGYTQVGDWVLLAPISDRAVRIYALMRMHCDGITKTRAWPAQKTLASMLGVKKVDTVQAAIKDLVDLGALNVEAITTGHGRCNRYIVHMTPPPGYDRGPRDRPSYYAEHRGGHPKSGVTRSGDHPSDGGDGSPPPGGSEEVQVVKEQTEEKEESKPSTEADASPSAEVSDPDQSKAGVQPPPNRRAHDNPSPGAVETTSSAADDHGAGSADDGGLFTAPTTPPKKPRAKPRTGPPEKFELSLALRAWFREEGLEKIGVDPRFETEQFLDYHRSRGNTMASWDAAWKTWMRKQGVYAQERSNNRAPGRDTRRSGGHLPFRSPSPEDYAAAAKNGALI